MLSRICKRLAESTVLSRIYNRVSKRMANRFGNGDTAASHNDSECNEKQTGSPRHWLSTFATILRVWQWISSATIYASFIYLYFEQFANYGLPEQIRTRAIENLSYAALAYHTPILMILILHRSKSKETRGWRFFAATTVIGDLFMMGLSISKMSILSAAGVLADCPGPNVTNYFKSNDLVRNSVNFASVRFGLGGQVVEDGLDLTCFTPKLVYLLSIIAIFSYTFSILLTGLQWQRYQATQDHSTHPGHVELAIPESIQHMQHIQVHHVQVPDPRLSFSGPPPQPQAPRPQEAPRYPQQPPRTSFEAALVPGGRMSFETISSFNADLYLVSDGFRPEPEIPTYSSGPPSYASRPPSYSSRPSSLCDGAQ
ncbi:hypothetical protein B0T25DRAFT_519997 [Lasiosphaeria hispida]|uniref:Uncharacterized protein n=1 Tax=Lasiosphaeria hispida TaxID=260671 RepID=A0AAJ0MCR4_9PEZI|nr:hypothetical protein B0T25DRAFT_519997 [Lasiosphaeria hispida]